MIINNHTNFFASKSVSFCKIEWLRKAIFALITSISLRSLSLFALTLKSDEHIGVVHDVLMVDSKHTQIAKNALKWGKPRSWHVMIAFVDPSLFSQNAPDLLKYPKINILTVHQIGNKSAQNAISNVRIFAPHLITPWAPMKNLK